MRNEEKQRTKETVSSYNEPANTSVYFEKSQGLVCYLSVPLQEANIFSHD